MEDRKLKIAVVGPESTGKSEMAQRLAAEWNTLYVPEYSRYYCEGLNREYTLQDEMNIFYGQLALEDSLMSVLRRPLIICDTCFLTVKVWSDHLFGFTPERVLEERLVRKYDFYLLMDIDLPWVDDPLRDFPDKREYFLEVWKKELAGVSGRYSLISGLGEARFRSGIEAVREFLTTEEQLDF